jgi:cytochrome c-type biogenesis protein CcmH
MFWNAPMALAKEAIPVGEDPVVQARMMRLATVLRCLVCQNQTIADSHADLALDLRNQIVELIKQGKSDDEIMEFMTARYGDFVLYRPPMKTTTMLLWFGPLFLVLVGGFSLYRSTQHRQRDSMIQAELTPEQKLLADQLLNRDASQR